MMKFSVPPGYLRSKPPVRPQLDPFIPIIDKILADDKIQPKKQQHTSKRIFERLRDEHAFAGAFIGFHIGVVLELLPLPQMQYVLAIVGALVTLWAWRGR